MKTTIIALITLMALIFTACTSVPTCQRTRLDRDWIMEAHGHGGQLR